MFKRLTSLLRFAGVLGVSLLTAGTLMAQDCPRGTLDSRFCDRDGDLVADAPTDPS
ncbi:MAG: phosphate/phosphite/phosphonate ABC transporter substrate-binding protein, partial [SAR324 cluster bacterium]|nr:phosphate/phosphite/phosphonate ABC transporter substrate-binding protein [SAR324 cluster bacterium]